MKYENERGSLTAEAALAFPIFLFAVLAIARLFIYDLRVYELERDLLRRAEIESVCLPSIEGLIGEPVKTDKNGDFWVRGSTVLDIAPVMFRDDTMLVHREIRFHSFAGHHVESQLSECSAEGETAEDASTDRTVYITEAGSVFHRSRDCPSLRLSVRSVMTEAVGKERNDDGGRYYPCEYCSSGEQPKMVFVTSDGTRYHYKIDCRSLKRTISEVKESEAGDKRPCKKCSGG